MSKKRVGKWLIFLVPLLVLACVLTYSHLNPVLNASNAMLTRYYSDVAELEADSDYILLVSVEERGKAQFRKGEDTSEIFATRTPVRVEKVFKGSVQSGSTVEIVESSAFKRNLTGVELYVIDSYRPMEKGRQYLLFLFEDVNDDDPFYDGKNITGLWQGKFVVPKTSLATYLPAASTHEAIQEKLEVGPGYIGIDYRQLHQSVLDKYDLAE